MHGKKMIIIVMIKEYQSWVQIVVDGTYGKDSNYLVPKLSKTKPKV